MVELFIKYLFGLLAVFFCIVYLLLHFNPKDIKVKITSYWKGPRKFTKIAEIIFLVRQFRIISTSQGRLYKWVFWLCGILIIFYLAFVGFYTSYSYSGNVYNINVVLFTLLFPLLMYYLIVFILYSLIKVSMLIDQMKPTIAIVIFVVAILFISFLTLDFLPDSKSLYLFMLVTMYIAHWRIFQCLIITAEYKEYLKIPSIKNKIYSKYIVAFNWLLILLVTLICEVVIIDKLIPNAFTAHEQVFDLVSITLSSFFTVDVGDLAIHTFGKIQGIVIVFSSVFFITVFIATIISKETKVNRQARVGKILRLRQTNQTNLHI